MLDSTSEFAREKKRGGFAFSVIEKETDECFGDKNTGKSKRKILKINERIIVESKNKNAKNEKYGGDEKFIA